MAFRIPLIPFIARMLPAKGGIYRAKGKQIQRWMFDCCWATVSRCDTEAEARRITKQMNAL
jgi:hypothetical protein